MSLQHGAGLPGKGAPSSVPATLDLTHGGLVPYDFRVLREKPPVLLSLACVICGLLTRGSEVDLGTYVFSDGLGDILIGGWSWVDTRMCFSVFICLSFQSFLPSKRSNLYL